MALLFMDSFDHVSSQAFLALKWDSVGSMDVTSSPVRTGTGAMRGVTATASAVKNIPVPGDVFILGFAIRFTGLPNPATAIIQFVDVATATHVAVHWDASGFLVIKRGTTTLATATSHAFALNSWYYLELKVVIHDTTGSVGVRVDGVSPTFSAALTGIDTRNAATGVVDRIAISGSSGGTLYVDDLYLCDDAGSVNNDFLGICVIERLLPQTATAGDHQQFTPSTGTDHGALVDENPPNDDTDYNSSDVVGQQDSYHYPSLTLTGTVLGVQTNLYVRKTDAGARTIAPIVRTGSTTYPGTAVSPLTTYKYFTEVWPTNPNTGIAWTAADIAGLQAGMKIVS